MDTGYRVPGGFNADRAFKHTVREDDLTRAHAAATSLWGTEIAVIDPMAGGGSIPLESARLGFHTLANEYNPVACSVLETTVDYPFRFGESLAAKARTWAKVWGERVEARLGRFYPAYRFAKVHAYIFARTVPCPDTQHPTPLVPDWHLLKNGKKLVAEPTVEQARGAWGIRMREVGRMAGQLREPPRPTYADGKGISLFTGRQIPTDYIKAKAQAGEMGRALYAVALKTPQGLEFQPPTPADLQAIQAAERELVRCRPEWERANVIPTERYPEVSSDDRPRLYGMPRWADLFSLRQLLCFGVLVEELNGLQPKVVAAEGEEVGEAVVHLLPFVIDKFTNDNSILGSWHAPRQVMRSVFDRHDFSFKPTFAEMAPCNSGSGLDWAVDNTVEAAENLAELPRHGSVKPAEITLGSATSLPHLDDGSVTAVVVDPPYADNVQYAELADFFYVWLKRTRGHRRPEWFSTYLCERDQEAVVNVSRHREIGSPGAIRGRRDGSAAAAKVVANAFYQETMTDSFVEAKRVLRDDGVLTVMFTHKEQEAWEALFDSLIRAGFTITATWPVKTESEHSLHQAKKNAAQSTVILVARKRPPGGGVGRFDQAMLGEIRARARDTAERLQSEGLNAVDQLVGSFGPTMEVYSRYDVVRTDTGEDVRVGRAAREGWDGLPATGGDQQPGLAGRAHRAGGRAGPGADPRRPPDEPRDRPSGGEPPAPTRRRAVGSGGPRRVARGPPARAGRGRVQRCDAAAGAAPAAPAPPPGAGHRPPERDADADPPLGAVGPPGRPGRGRGLAGRVCRGARVLWGGQGRRERRGQPTDRAGRGRLDLRRSGLPAAAGRDEPSAVGNGGGPGTHLRAARPSG